MIVLYPLSDFLDGNCAISDLAPSYFYEGRCPQSGDRLRLPRTALAEAIADGLMQYLAKDDRYSSEGKMYGVLLVELPTGEQRVLKAFSGLLFGQSVVEGWVPPIPGRDEVALEEARTLAELEAIKQELIALKQLSERQQYETRQNEFDPLLQTMSDRHRHDKQQRYERRQRLCQTLTGEALSVALEQLDEESRRQGIERRILKRQQQMVLQPLKTKIEAADARMCQLKQQRKNLSRQLQEQLHAAYSLTNFSGQSLSLQQLMPRGSMPTGTGDCCAPKLLHYAATQRLKPLAMAEFWWGSSVRDKVQGKFYGACTERCQPLMGFLLSGLSQWTRACVPTSPPDPAPPKSPLEIPPSPPWGVHTSRVRGLSTVRSLLARVKKEGTEILVPLFKGDLGESDNLLHPGKRYVAPCRGGVPIIYEDEWLIAVNKPPQLLSVPGRYHHTFDSVLSRLRHLLPDGMALMAVHRLDQETSGILLLARDRSSHRQLSQQFQQRQVHKIYEAVLSGSVTVEQGAIALPLWADPENRPYQKVDERGKPSLTHFQVIARKGDCTRVEFMPQTGRTHQLRVHSADPRGLGVPILGDRLYGCRAVNSRLHLHARELHLQHPQSGQTLHLQAKTPF
ncbi:MAG: RluA family pseudouridine synthase [Kastovskya adunca ATA6-11-RM4]|jgi:tRNA pseudouridine32 synthase/23S rRNA pseudouridine746 synthase|nr:RluA family pseudouridine synthase [Kastovskya adunca ATA6-11-RM4]